MLSAKHEVPWVFQLRSRGNPARLSNTAGDARSDSTLKLELLSLFESRFNAFAQCLDAMAEFGL
jgi:hypothetical protein